MQYEYNHIENECKKERSRGFIYYYSYCHRELIWCYVIIWCRRASEWMTVLLMFLVNRKIFTKLRIFLSIAFPHYFFFTFFTLKQEMEVKTWVKFFLIFVNKSRKIHNWEKRIFFKTNLSFPKTKSTEMEEIPWTNQQCLLRTLRICLRITSQKFTFMLSLD